MFRRLPVDRSSKTVTLRPSARYASARCEPMNPAPPVMRTDFVFDTCALLLGCEDTREDAGASTAVTATAVFTAEIAENG
jgi:hypothetical protein